MSNIASLSRAILPSDGLSINAYKRRMKSEREIIVKAVNTLLQETGLSSSGLAKKSGIAASTLNRFLFRDPNYILSQKTLNALCRSAGYESYEGFAAMRFTNDYVRKMPVTAYVGDDGEVHAISGRPDQFEFVVCPPGLDHRHVVAIRIAGNSMYPVLHKNWIVYYSERRDIAIPIIQGGLQVPYNQPTDEPLSEFEGKPCVVRMKDGRSMLRTLEAGRTPGRYNLISYNAPHIKDAAVEWAAKIVFIKTT
jgi:hypothetical protein